MFKTVPALAFAVAFSLAPAAGSAQEPKTAQSPQVKWRAQGPRSLILSYKVAPGDRLLFRATVRTSMLPRLERLRASGALESYHVLASRYLDGPWDLMSVLNFRSAGDLARWREVEDQAPGGLDETALRLVSAAETTPGDRLRSAFRPVSRGRRPVFLVVPYEYTVSTDDYITYADAYVLPQADGWMRNGALNGYDLYLARYYAGRPWTSMLLLSYDGDEGLAQRESVVQAVRTRLAADPEWKKVADSKHSVRLEKQAVVADEMLPLAVGTTVRAPPRHR